MEKTIVALATPPGNSGVAVVRISGENSKEILQKITHSNINFTPRHMYLKDVFVGDIVDKCLVVFFASPNSYTGEDVAEIQSHGGYFLSQKIIEECINLGASMATAGEFSKRAFINGKMSIDQAEGIMDLINSESEMQAKMSSSLVNGKLFEMINSYQTDLTDMLAEIEAKLDYPEYDFSAEESSNTIDKINNLIDNLTSLISDSKSGLIIKNGVNIAIVGAPNVGKSSILNALTKSNKAIVTEIAGTTRDVVEAQYEYNGIIFKLFDTAGIHESDDIVEKIGIDRAKKTLEDSDLVLLVSDENNICDIKTSKPHISIFNKSDISKIKNQNFDIFVSAKSGENLDKLKQLIFDRTVKSDIRSDKFYLTNTRHIDCIKRACEALKSAKDAFNTTTLDIISAELKFAWSILGEITGITSDEAIIDKIFSKFCLGK